MNLNIKINKSDAAKMLAPVFADKIDGGIGDCPIVTVEIVEGDATAPRPTFVPVPLQNRLPELKRLIRLHKDGQYHKLYIIKEIRTVTGWGIKDAKDFFELFLD